MNEDEHATPGGRDSRRADRYQPNGWTSAPIPLMSGVRPIATVSAAATTTATVAGPERWDAEDSATPLSDR
jgi:hypothetical protein